MEYESWLNSYVVPIVNAVVGCALPPIQYLQLLPAVWSQLSEVPTANDTGAGISVEATMGTAAMSVALLNTAATVRVAKFAACAPTLVVMPVVTVTVQVEFDAKMAVAAVRVKVAFFSPDNVPTAVKVVVPQPLEGATPPGVAAIFQYGRMRTMLSVCGIIGAFNLKVYEMGDATYAMA